MSPGKISQKLLNRLHLMVRAYKEQENMLDIKEFPFNDRLSMMRDWEIVSRSNRRLERRIRQAAFKQKSAYMENIIIRMRHCVRYSRCRSFVKDPRLSGL
jgi:hypothetical protein